MLCLTFAGCSGKTIDRASSKDAAATLRNIIQGRIDRRADLRGVRVLYTQCVADTKRHWRCVLRLRYRGNTQTIGGLLTCDTENCMWNPDP